MKNQNFYFNKIKKRKAQSAMEYLMTYGWAILIIAVAILVLFQMGVFNNNNSLTPKAPPGSCKVNRPYGPGTTSLISLEGMCNEKIPQYVATFNIGGNFGYVSAPALPPAITSSGVTVSLWAYPLLIQNSIGLTFTDHWSQQMDYYNGRFMGTVNGSNWISAPFNSAVGIWYFEAITGTPSGDILYINGEPVNSSNPASNAIGQSGPVAIGAAGYNYFPFTGYISNVQVYNTSLSANDMQALYQEGIGGAPIDLQHLVAWWPLNGNANDYSGNGNNGQATGVTYTATYTPP